jgi:hypothetical protein
VERRKTLLEMGRSEINGAGPSVAGGGAASRRIPCPVCRSGRPAPAAWARHFAVFPRYGHSRVPSSSRRGDGRTRGLSRSASRFERARLCERSGKKVGSFFHTVEKSFPRCGKISCRPPSPRLRRTSE